MRSPLEDVSMDCEIEISYGLTPKAHPGSTVEGHETPTDIGQLPCLPSLGAESFSVFAINLLSTVHMVSGPADTCPSPDHYWRLAVWATTTRYNGGFRSNTDIDR